jgi:predicted ATPase
MTPLMLSRLARSQAQEMLERVTDGKALPTEVSRQIVSKTDGVPLFVEELTKIIVESGLLREVNGHYELTGPLPPLAIPITLQDSLTARLDRLSTAREVAQLGATLGRDFSYELLQAVADFDASTLQVALGKLVEAEVLYQRGLPPHARYSFKHALIQDTAYQSLLKSARQQHHRRIAQVLGEKFIDVAKNQPELIAHHYTEAQLFQLAIPYWQRAGEIAASRSATVEAVSHISKALELLATQPDTYERKQQETALHLVLGPVLMAAKGWSAPETEVSYKRSSELCQQIGNTSQLFPALYGICTVYAVRPELKKVCELGRNFLTLAQQHRDLGAHIEGHFLIGYSLFFLADLPAALEHLDQAIALYGSEPRRELAAQYGHDPGMSSRFFAACALWLLGYPERAKTSALETVSLA